MYLKESDKLRIIQMKDAGFTSRHIAKVVLGSETKKSTVNDYLNRLSNNPIQESPVLINEHKPNLPKILAYDLETNPAISATFGRHKIFLGQDNIIQEGGKILCFGYRWVGSMEESVVVSMTQQEAIDNDDSRVVGILWDLFSEADAVVAHNNARFDYPVLKARVIANGFPPLPTVKVLDTYVMASKGFRFPNNKLDSLAAFFGLERKVDAGGINTWLGFMRGEKDAMQHMIDYCKHDTDLLHDIYLKLRAFGHAGSDINYGHYSNGDAISCPSCGSHDVDYTGRNITTAVSVFEEIRCNSCGAVARTRQPTNTKDKRKNIVVTPKLRG